MQTEEVAVATAAVLGASAPLPADSETVAGYDWDGPTDYEKLLGSYHRTGFQATNFGLAVDEINRMLKCRSIPLTEETADIYEDDPFLKKKTNCTIFLGYTSNLVSSGLRDTIRFLVRERLVDCLVTTAGGVEEDIIKCLCPSYLGSWQLPGPALRARGINRIGNILVPNDNYCAFERWLTPVLNEMHDQQDAGEVSWTPSKVASRLGERIQDENSILHWAYKNHIPVFSPALTDGSLGDMMFFHSYKRPGFILDILEDLKRINTIALKANNSGMIILGGGVVKHHICNANLMRNGADYSVYINTGLEADGSDSGAPPDEAVSWGKIKPQAKPVKLFGDATVLFPLVVAQSFAKHHFCSNKKNV